MMSFPADPTGKVMKLSVYHSQIRNSIEEKMLVAIEIICA